MRSPFPGMDPYLEDPAMWSEIHARLIVALGDQLAEKVTPNFVVRIEQRVYIVEPFSDLRFPIVPDVYIVAPPRSRSETAAQAGAIQTPTIIEPWNDYELHDRYLEIYDRQSHEVITTIEVLSPINKHRGAPGYETYHRKRQAVFDSPVHWIEIDLVREGERPAELVGRSDYYAMLKRGNTARPYEAWLFNLRSKMPTIAVPLDPSHPDVPLDLQAAFDTVYVRGQYADSIDYSQNTPRPLLAVVDQEWVQELVREWMSARVAQKSS